jgi:uracil-DNA glycosylase
MIKKETLNSLAFDLEPSWNEVLAEELKKPYMHLLAQFVEQERNQILPVYPPRDLVFNAFKKTPFDKVKVVIVGQDPYHNPGQAHGLSFSVPRGIPQPPSLKNIFKELKEDLGIKQPPHGCLQHWAEQGVMLLNALLTVRHNTPLSHQGKGWEQFTDSVIYHLTMRKKPVIFVLWGKYAQDKFKQSQLSEKNHNSIILATTHPSPFSAHQGFLGCRHFSQINQILTQMGETPINWSIT